MTDDYVIERVIYDYTHAPEYENTAAEIGYTLEELESGVCPDLEEFVDNDLFMMIGNEPRKADLKCRIIEELKRKGY